MQEEYRNKRKATLTAVKELIIDRLGLDFSVNEIDDDAALFGAGLGLDSIDALDLVIGIEESFDIKIGQDELQVFRSVNTVVDHIIITLGGEVYSAENTGGIARVSQVLHAEIAEAYDRLRKEHVAIETSHRLFELQECEDALDALSSAVSSDLSALEPNKIAFSAILDREGLVVDVVQIYMFENKYWVFTSPGIQASEDAMLGMGEHVREVSNDYASLTLEGPYAWKLVRDLIGFEVLGLSYGRFMEAQIPSLPVVMGRISNTGEYGYRLTVPSDRLDDLHDALNALDMDQPIYKLSDAAAATILAISAAEMRSPRMHATMQSGDDPISNELRWMIGFRKSEYVGQSAVQNSVDNAGNRILAFVTNQAPADMSDVFGASVSAGSEIVGHVRQLHYSPTLGLYIGYCELLGEWAYAGLKGLCINHAEAGEILTISTPAFLPLSSKVQMH